MAKLYKALQAGEATGLCKIGGGEMFKESLHSRLEFKFGSPAHPQILYFFLEQTYMCFFSRSMPNLPCSAFSLSASHHLSRTLSSTVGHNTQ